MNEIRVNILKYPLDFLPYILIKPVKFLNETRVYYLQRASISSNDMLLYQNCIRVSIYNTLNKKIYQNYIIILNFLLVLY